MAARLKDKVQETAACCCVDVGTIVDNSDCTASYWQVFATQVEAEKMLASLTEQARATESDPCLIESQINKTTAGFALKVELTFACAVEMLIFQLGLR